MENAPLAYFLTFTTHGTWLHGDPEGSIIIKDGQSIVMKPNPGMQYYQQRQLKNKPVILESRQREIVRDTIVEVCDFRHWDLFALHVRSNHVHVVLRSNKEIGLTLSDLKKTVQQKTSRAWFCT